MDNAKLALQGGQEGHISQGQCTTEKALEFHRVFFIMFTADTKYLTHMRKLMETEERNTQKYLSKQLSELSKNSQLVQKKAGEK